MQHTQTSIVDEVQRRHELLIEAWTKWRDAQADDEHKFLVDGIFATQLRTLELLLAQLGCDVIPF